MPRVDSVHIAPQLLAPLSELDEFKGAWRALGTLAPNRLRALRRIATIESTGSSTRIEGSRLTDREVERLLGRLDIQAFATQDEQEVAGYAEIMEKVFQSRANIRLTENHVKQRHRDLQGLLTRHGGGRSTSHALPQERARSCEAAKSVEPSRSVAARRDKAGCSGGISDGKYAGGPVECPVETGGWKLRR